MTGMLFSRDSLSAPDPGKPVFGFITNGSDFQFLKLVRSETPVFGLSGRFYMANAATDLYQVLQILKQLGGMVQQ